MATPNFVTFTDWQQKTNASLMSAAEELLEKLEDTSDLLSEIDEKYIGTTSDKEEGGGEGGGGGSDDHKSSMIQRFHAGLDSARNLVNVLKREKWRLSKREMSVELRMGELEDYKSHLKNDMSSLNQTVEALSLRVVQLENQLVEAQEVQENLEAELLEHKNSLQDANDRNVKLFTENEDLKRTLQGLKKANQLQKENQMLQDEVSVLSQENSKLKDMVRNAEALASPPAALSMKMPAFPEAASSSSSSTYSSSAKQCQQVEEASLTEKSSSGSKKDDNLSKLTKEFLDELTSLELRERRASEEGRNVDGSGGVLEGDAGSKRCATKKVSGADV